MDVGLSSITCSIMLIHFCRDFLMYVRFGSNLFFDSRDLRRHILVDIRLGYITSSIVYISLSSNLFVDSRDLFMDINFRNITGSIVDIGESMGSLSFNSNRSLLTLGHGGSTGQGDNGQEDKE